jgi:hypothetical protein
MSIFDSILEKLGMKKTEVEKDVKAAPTPAAPAAPVKSTPPVPPPTAHVASVAPTHEVPGRGPVAAPPPPPAAPKPTEMAHEDLVAHLDYLAKTGPIKGLNWRVSINDFMALLGLPHKPEDIKALAVELGCPESEMADSYTRNVWTHKALMKKLAENGGNVPASLKD